MHRGPAQVSFDGRRRQDQMRESVGTPSLASRRHVRAELREPVGCGHETDKLPPSRDSVHSRQLTFRIAGRCRRVRRTDSDRERDGGGEG